MRRIGLIGSPLLHWGLVALIGCALWGQAVRHEGVVLLYVGVPVADDATAYTGSASSGPLFRERYTNTTFELLEARRSLVVSGIERGASPRVRARVGDGEAVESWVYPNHPLRVAGLTVNNVDSGPGVVLAVERGVPATDGPGAAPLPDLGATLRLPLLKSASGYRAVARVDSQDAGSFSLSVSQLPGSKIAIAADDDPPVELSVGETAEVRGVRLQFAEPTTWATVAVVNDPSVPWLYAAMWLTVAGAVLTLLRPAVRDDDSAA